MNRVRCPACGRLLNVPDRVMENKIRCPGCQADFIPAHSRSAPAEESELVMARPGAGAEARDEPDESPRRGGETLPRRPGPPKKLSRGKEALPRRAHLSGGPAWVLFLMLGLVGAGLVLTFLGLYHYWASRALGLLGFGLLIWGFVWYYRVCKRLTGTGDPFSGVAHGGVWFYFYGIWVWLFVHVGQVIKDPKYLGKPALLEGVGLLFLIFSSVGEFVIKHSPRAPSPVVQVQPTVPPIQVRTPRANPLVPAEQPQGPLPAPQRQANQATELLGHWPLNEGQGDRATDSSGHDHPGTLVNAGWVKGDKASAVHFTGPGSYLNYGSAPDFSFAAGEPFTFAFWVRTRRPAGTLLSQRSSRSGAPVIDILLEGGRVSAEVRQDGSDFAGPAMVKGRSAVNDGNWHLITLTRDGNGIIALYLDGALQQQAVGRASGGAITTDLRSLGAELYWKTHVGIKNADFEGDMADLSIYKGALQPKEIQTMAGKG